VPIARCAIAFAFAAIFASPALAAGDPDSGQAVFQRCQACHSVKPGVNAIGPSLFGVVGRPSATVPGFTYSPAMKVAHKVWNAATLDAYLTNPNSYIPGIRMVFVGLPDPQDRADLIAYLATLK